MWRYGYRRLPLEYDPLYWGAVFPLGMYAVATYKMAEALKLDFLDSIPKVFLGLALLAWLATAEPDDVEQLQELLYGLYALLIVHFHKEEEDYLPLLEGRPREEVAAIFERMGGHGHAH